MLKFIASQKMGRGKHDWLDSHFHFSFAEYYNPENIHFGVLRVINDDLIKPGTGFPTHPHKDMEIISYIVNGEISHVDSMKNERTLNRGEVQYMSAGTGIRHSEYNHGNETLRLLQIWILPDANNHTPNYGDYRFPFSERENRWLPMVSSYQNVNSLAPIRIHADVNIYTTFLNKGNHIDFEVHKNRQAYLVLIEGNTLINDIPLSTRDALEITEENIRINPTEDTHILVIEMAKA